MNRVYPPAAKGHTGLLYDDLFWLQPDLNQLPELSRYDDSSVSWRLYQITELSEGKAAGRRLAMENVVASLRHSNSAFVYVLSGNASGIKLHIGVASDSDQAGGGPLIISTLNWGQFGNGYSTWFTPSRPGPILAQCHKVTLNCIPKS